MATVILGAVLILGTLIEISVPEFRETGFSGMYFIWAFNSLTYILTVRGTGVFRPVYEYLSIFAFTGILVGMAAKAALGDFPFGRPIKGQPHVFQLDNRLDGFLA